MKLLLTIKSGTLAGKIYELTSGAMTIGRTESSTVRFDPLTEKIASKQHAFIEVKPDGFYLIDNQSTNGTFLNGEQINISKLNSGDRIQFGRNGVEASVSIETESDYKPTSEPTFFQPAGNFSQFHRELQVNQPFQSRPADWRNSISNLGLGNLKDNPDKSQAGKYIGVGLTIFGLVVLSVIVLLIFRYQIGLPTAIAASIIAFIPAMLYILPFIWLDRYDPEPLWLLALAFAWGALVAVIFSFVVNTYVGRGVSVAIGGPEGEALGTIVSTVFSAPIFEEASKGLGLLLLLLFFRRQFDDILDGIVFAGLIALGFATVENVLYYGRGLNDIPLYQTTEEGVKNFGFLLILRGIFSPFAHATFTSMIGIGCGISRESHNIAVKIIMPVLGYICAVALHMIWNGMAMISAIFFGGLTGFIIGYIFLEIPLFLIFVGFCFYVMRRQNKILREMLALDVARGMIPQEHYEKATSAFKSTAWLASSIFNGKYKPTSRYLRAIGKLGLSYWHIQRATAAQGHTGSFQQNPILRDEVLKWRDQV